MGPKSIGFTGGGAWAKYDRARAFRVRLIKKQKGISRVSVEIARVFRFILYSSRPQTEGWGEKEKRKGRETRQWERKWNRFRFDFREQYYDVVYPSGSDHQ